MRNKKQNAITLIALVITIIVMLILVAVTINMAVNGGLFIYAGNAASGTEKAKQKEQKIAEGYIEVDEKKYDSPEDFINGVESPTEKFSAIYTETKEYKENGVTTAWIPKGFSVGMSEGISKVNDGLVIQDDKGNQFVWIPVEVIGNTQTEKEAAFDDIRIMKGNYKEPVSGDETEYNAMRASVINFGGFYIARYEAGYATGRTKSDSSVAISPLIKKGAYPYNYVSWTDAVSSSRNMYTDKNKYGVTSTLCYGVQWDAMLNFLGKASETNSVSWGNFKNAGPFDFTGEYYTYDDDEWKNDITSKTKDIGMLLQTGAGGTRNQIKNINDVVGNLEEWTMTDASGYRHRRGISYNYNGGIVPTRSPSSLGSPSVSGYTTGFRPALYL